MFDFRKMLEENGRNILVVGLNPCLDVSLTMDRLLIDKTNYYHAYHEDLGGKGSNVIRAIHAMSGAGSLFSPNFPEDGNKVEGLMRAEGIRAHLVNLPGDLRVNYKLHDSDENGHFRMTELNSPGEQLAPAAIRLLEREWMRQIEQDQLLVLSGSLAPGLPDESYRDLITAQHKRGGRVVLDTKGRALRLGLEAGPDFVKPNRDELAEISGMPCDSAEEAAAAALKLREMGADVVLASLAADGAILTRGKAVFYAKTPVNPDILRLAGAGDAMTATLACFASRDDDLTDDELPDVLRWTLASSQAAISRTDSTMPSLDEIEAWVDRIDVQQIG